MIKIILFLFCFVNYCHAIPPQNTHEKTSYVFPKRIQTVQSTDDYEDEITASLYDEDFEEPFDERPIAQSNPTYHPPAKAVPKKRKVRGKHFRIDVAPQYSYMVLRSHGMKKNRGSLGGISGEVEYKKREHVYADASFLWDQGELKANGQRSHEWKEAIAQGMIGYTMAISDRMSTTAYVGFGYRKVMDHKSYAGLNPRITLNYYQYFVPFGFLTDYCFNDRLTLSLNLKAMPAVDSRVYLTNITNVFWKLKNHGNYEVDLPFQWRAAKTKYLNFDLTLEPFFKYWVLGPNAKLHMHSRTQTYWGVELQLGFTL